MNTSRYHTLLPTIVLVVFFVATTSSVVHGQTQGSVLNPVNNPTNISYTLLEPLPCINGATSSGCQTGSQITNLSEVGFSGYVQYAFNLLIALAAVMSVFMIVWGGFQYMSTDSYSGKKDGLEKLKNAVYGLLLVLCSYLILQTIDPRLVNIPTTLVKPLNIEYKPSEFGYFFDDLAKAISKFHTDVQQAKVELTASEQNASTLEQQKKSLCSQLIAEAAVSNPLVLQQNTSGVYRDPCVALASQSSSLSASGQSLAAQVLAKDSALMQERANAVLIVAKSALNEQVLNSDPSTGSAANKTPEQLAADLNIEYANRRAALMSAGANPEQLQALDNYANYSNKLEQINNQVSYATQVVINNNVLSGPVAWWYQSSNAKTLNEAVGYAQEQINAVVRGCSSGISDPALCDQLTKKATEARQKLKSLKI